MIGLNNYGNTEDVYISRAKGLYFTWANGSGTHAIRQDTTNGFLSIEPYSTTPLMVNGRLTVGSKTMNVERAGLTIIDSTDCANLVLQGMSNGVGKNRWWITGDTTSNVLYIEGNGNTKPTSYPITITDNRGVGFSDSIQYSSSGAWLRKSFWSVTWDSMGIVSYNTVQSKLDTAWLTTK